MFRDEVVINLAHLKRDIEGDYMSVMETLKKALVISLLAYRISKKEQPLYAEFEDITMSDSFEQRVEESIEDPEGYLNGVWSSLDGFEINIFEQILKRSDDMYAKYIRDNRDTYISVLMTERYHVVIGFNSFLVRD